MANTTNYGWETPDDTDLVKDGASAIRTLGSSIDTTTKALNPSTTLGDIEYRSSTANTNTRLGIGSSGQVLTVSGGVPAWSTPSSGSMTLLSTTSLTGSSVTLNSISQSYKDLRIEIKDLTFDTNNSELLIRYNSDTGSNYDQILTTSEVGVSTSTAGYQNLTSNNLTYAFGMQSTSVDAAFQLDLYDYKDTSAIRLSRGLASFQKGYSTAGNRLLVNQVGFYKNVGTAISSVSLTMSAGNFSTGTVYLYGVN